MSEFVKMTSRPERAAHAIVRDARRGNPDLSSVVEVHTARLNRGELVSVLNLLFAEMASLYRSRRHA